MKPSNFILSILLAVFALTALRAQERYLNQVFSAAAVTTTVYGNNYSVITVSQLGHTFPLPQRVDIYRAVGDTATNRPLIIYLQTGNFLPISVNGSCGGSITDSSNVEFATRLAKMGYVVAVASYRQGWRPDLPAELLKRFSLINAVYRGVQDVHSCIRFFRKSVAVGGNPYGIDQNKIVVWGQGTGGYVSMAAAYLNTYSEILTTSDPLKFQLPSTADPTGYVPMVIPQYNGNVDGSMPPGQTVCTVDAAYNALTQFPIGDTLCTPQNEGYPSNFNLCVNMSGALCDSTWLDAGEMPLISYHVHSDFFAPCGTSTLNGGIQPIVEVTGSCGLQDIIEENGNNAIFEEIPLSVDPFKVAGYSGFFPFEGTPDNSASPWEWRKSPNPAPPSPLATCNNDAVSARLYIDTIVGYFAPRACFALNLPCKTKLLSAKNLPVIEVGLNIAPVPTTAELRFNAKETIRSINIYDLNGRIVRTFSTIDNTFYSMQRDGLVNGLYIAEIRFDKGSVRRKVVFQ